MRRESSRGHSSASLLTLLPAMLDDDDDGELSFDELLHFATTSRITTYRPSYEVRARAHAL